MSDTGKISAVQWRGDNLAIVTRFAPGLVWQEESTLWARLADGEMPIPAGWILYSHAGGQLLACSERTWAEYYSPNRARRRARQVEAAHV